MEKWESIYSAGNTAVLVIVVVLAVVEVQISKWEFPSFEMRIPVQLIS